MDYNDQMLFTASNDGTLIIYYIKDDQAFQSEKDDGMVINYAEDFLISRQKYKAKLLEIKELDQQINDLKISNKLQYDMKKRL